MPMNISALKANLSSPATSFMWEIMIPNPIGGGNSETLALRAQSTNVPGRSVGNMEVSYKQGAKLQFPGKLTYDHTWSCTFIEGEDNAVWQAFYAWANQIVNDITNNGAVDTDVKTDIYLNLLTKKDGIPYRKIVLKGCYVSSIDSVSLDMANDGVIMQPITFRYDWWEPQA